MDGISGPLTDHQVDQLRRVKASASHLLALIEQVLSLSRIEARQEEVRLERMDARAIVAEATALVEPLMATRGLALEVDLPAEPCSLETDVTKVRQILLNLLTNAAKFTERGTVRCRTRVQSDEVVLEVSDTGRGIAPADLHRVFEPFWQGDPSARNRPEGVGLGLSVSRRLAELLGGALGVESAWGSGSTFSLRLPRSTASGEMPIASAPPGSMPEAPAESLATRR